MSASAFQGISFTISDDIGAGSSINFQLSTYQTTPTYFGGLCPGEFGNGCNHPGADVALSAEPTVVTLSWADLVGAEPGGVATPEGIGSFVWAIFNVDDSPVVNVTMDGVTFW